MSSDVEMLPFHQIPRKFSPTDPDLTSPPPPSLSSRTSSISRHLPLGLDPDPPAPIPALDDPDDHLDPQFIKKPSSSAKPGSSAATKPRSAKPRPRSPSPSPPPPPPPLQTIRLEITLGGPDNYEVDISSIAKATGQRPPTPVLAKRDTSDSEPDDDPDKDKPKPKKRKKNIGSEYYDLADPFIDDSELAVDERTYFAQTKQQGFYVSSGEVALLKDKTPKKPKSKRNPPGEPATTALSTVKQEGTRDSPIALLSEDEDRPGHKRKRYLTVVEGGKKRKIVDVHSFHPDLQAAIDVLKLAISKESWEVKGKFPPAVKPVLLDVAIKAVILDEYDEHFFNLMPILFPYNKYTMTKLIKRTVFADHTRILTERQDALLEELATLTKDGFAKAQEEWEKAVVLWEKKQEKAKAEAEAGAGAGAGAGAPDAEGASADGKHADDAGSGMEQDNPPKDAAGKDATKEPHPPPRRYRLTDTMKVLVWRLVALSNEVCRLENEKNSLEGSNVQVSEQGLRKVLYQKIVSAFPEGWMSSGQISREVSSMKKRLEKEAMENES